MIGGKVIETIVLTDKVWINCRERNSTSECAVYAERNANSEAIKPGDIVWWQAGNIMWTPASKEFADRRIKKISGSGVSRPASDP